MDRRAKVRMIRTSLAALAMVAVAAAGPWDRATAGEPMVLIDAQRDQGTAGKVEITLKRGARDRRAVTMEDMLMKITFISVMALGVAAAMAGPADRALAGEPMVLSDAELDQVTAGQEQISLVFSKITPAVEGEIRWTFVNAFPKKLDGVHIVLTHPAGSVDRGTPDRQR
jgi:hypothetical protein